VIILVILRTIWTAIFAVLATVIGGLGAIIAGFFGVEDRTGGIFDHTPRYWSRAILWAAGVKTVVHNPERMAGGEPRLYLSNHLSWFDIPALAGALPRYKFVAKAELFKIPVFGPAIRAIGMVPMERQNRKAAFEAYKVAADKIRSGSSVVVFPEGSRGESYPIRPFKKGPFVLAIASGAPIVPVLLHGTHDVFPKNGWLVRPGQFDIHLLEPVPTAGLDYPDREELAEKVRNQIVDALASIYGIESEPIRSSRQPQMADSD
jgi:1-acyl-sn-glycerol-3-phosphate acyltransferase